MRPLHWTKLVPPLLGRSVWASVDVEAAPMDAAQTEELFAAPRPPPKRPPAALAGGSAGSARSAAADGGSCGMGGAPSGAESGGATSAAGPGGGARRPSGGGGGGARQPLLVISIQRANNVGIFLKRLEKLLTLPQLINTVLRLESAVLDAELLENVLANLPPETEAKRLRALRDVDPEALQPAERFCFEMARLPRLRPMLHALRLRQSLPTSLERASDALSAVAHAARQLMTSPALRALLGSLLRHGNFINAGTNRANARGLRLDALEKARSLKTADGKCSLLEHACRATRLTRDALCAELGGVRAATKLSLLDVIRIVEELKEGVGLVGAELALCPIGDLEEEVAHEVAHGAAHEVAHEVAHEAAHRASAGASAGGVADAAEGGCASAAVGGVVGEMGEEAMLMRRFRRAMAPFHTSIEAGLQALEARRDETRALLRQLAEWLGEDPNSANPDAILRQCADLVDTALANAAAPEDAPEDGDVEGDAAGRPRL